jgi:Methylase involved in ubiquinone/menaquinone biosynthesis
MTDGMDKKTMTLAYFIDKNRRRNIKRLLVVGCGSGEEAAVLAKHLKIEVVGIDVVEKFDIQASQIATLKRGDGMDLEFENASFDFVYSFHALEHIQKPHLAIKEIWRVLKDEGGCIIGTPNRGRLLGYLGSTCSLKEKILWNLADWQKRIIGEFRNESGAHAGFVAREMKELLEVSFQTPEDITKLYYLRLYSKYEMYLKVTSLLKLDSFLFPSIYFMGFKK